MSPDTALRAKGILDRYAAVNWREPSYDAERITAAYQRWQAALGLARPIRLVRDPADAGGWISREVAENRGVANEVTSGFWMLLNGNAILRSMGLFRPEPVPAPPPAIEWDIAVAWACALSWSTSRAAGVDRSTCEFSESEAAALARAMPRMVGGKRASLKALPRINGSALGLFDPPPRVMSAVRDVLGQADNEVLWQFFANTSQDAEMARGFNIDADALGPNPEPDEVIEATISLSEPMIEACESGAFAHIFSGGELIVVASPALWTDGRRLHRADGPALCWPRTAFYAWKGCVVPEEFFTWPERTTPLDIRAITDERLQHALVDLYAHTHGHRRCMQDLGGTMMHADQTGRLWGMSLRSDLPPPLAGDIKLVEVANGTAESDGSFKTYWLAVPPEMRTAKQAVAWTYGMTPEDYDGLVIRT